MLVRLVVLLVGTAFLLPGTALGATTTIGFDDQSPGTELTTQYADAGGAGQGVTFFTQPGSGDTGNKPVIEVPPAGEAQSGSQVANIGICPGCEQFVPFAVGTFGTTRNFVSARVGYLGAPSTHTCADLDTDVSCAVVTLTAYDSSGNAIATSSPVTVSQGAGIHTLVTVATAAATIAGFRISGRDSIDNNKTIAIDDLSFSADGPPPPPDFSLAPTNGNLVMRQGGSITDRINIGRFNGSAGNVQLALSGPLPAGVHASFAPNPATGASSDLVLTADADSATTGFNPVTLTITGSPGSPAVGAIGHTVQINLQVRSAFDVSVEQPNVDIAPCEVSVPVNLVRDFALTDPVALSVTGLANGLQASFSPATATFPGGAAGQTVSLVIDGPGTGFPVPPTTLTIHAVAPNLPERTATVTVSGTCPATYDPRVTSMQISQGAQSPFLPEVDPARHPPNVVNYATIDPTPAKLRAGGPTVVRVYANLAIGPAGGAPNVPMVLYGSSYDRFGQAKALPGSPILPTYIPPKLTPGAATADPADVYKAAAAYSFTLPPAWTKSELAVGTGFLPTGGTTQKLKPCETTECTANDNFQIVHIPMQAAPPVTIKPAQLTVDGQPPLPDPSSVFSLLKAVDPLETIVQPYAGTIDITDISDAFKSCNATAVTNDDFNDCSDTANDDATDRFEDWVCENPPPDPGWDIGVNTGVARGLTSPNVCVYEFDYYRDAAVEVNRPLTSVAHEFFHLLGRPHASDCSGGGSNGQTAESWPPDERGLLQGVGLNPVQGSANPGAYRVMGTPADGWYDFMSYCAGDSNSWVSVHNWNAAFEEHRYHRSVRPARLRATGPKLASLHVSGFAGADGTVSITSVAPVSARAQPASESGYHLIGLDAPGNVVADLQMLSSPTHADGRPPALALDGVIPAAGVVSVAIENGGAALATRAASAHVPVVSVTGVPAFRRGRATIRWRASDADKDPLQARVEYSADAGRTYRQIASGPDHGRVRLPARLLSRSSHARVRVRVNDGFRETAASSRTFRSPGGAPVVSILSPKNGIRQPRDAPLVLSGQAFDDAGASLTGKRLRWFIAGVLIGTGTKTAPAGLPAGRHRVRLVARDRFGRVGRAAITVRLTAARPLFLTLKAPASVKRSARSIAVKVSSSLRAQLTVRGGRGKQRFVVYRKTRTLRIRVVPGRKRLNLRLTLAAGGRTTPAAVQVARR